MTLGELFAGIANAIRSKDGTTDRIPALTFPERIMAISGGGGGNGGPLVKVTVQEGADHEINVPVTISARVSVTAEDYVPPKTHALYNGVRLPKIPESVLASYPYVFIRHNTTNGYYEMYCATGTTYYSSPNICFSTSTARQRYRIAIASAETATAWESNGTSTANVGVGSTRPVLWSNHDIPNGSATATDIYFGGTDPVPTN